jgi:hypothetical protein
MKKAPRGALCVCFIKNTAVCAIRQGFAARLRLEGENRAKCLAIRPQWGCKPGEMVR